MDVDGRDVIPSDDSAMNSKTNAVKSNRWTNEELLLAVQGVRQYGLDFKVHPLPVSYQFLSVNANNEIAPLSYTQAIAEVIGNKTDAHIRSFYNNYKRRYNLESVLEEFKQTRAEQVGSLYFYVKNV